MIKKKKKKADVQLIKMSTEISLSQFFVSSSMARDL